MAQIDSSKKLNADLSCKTPRWRQLKNDLNNLNVAQFIKHIKVFPNTNIVDVRTTLEFDQGHLPNAINIDYLADDFLDHLDSLDKEQQYIVYCRSGRRSLRVCTWMVNGGFDRTKIFNLEFGYQSWLTYEMNM